MASKLSLCVLGPLEVWRDGERVALGAAKQRALLALLLLRRGGVGRDVLIDALWGEAPPKGVQNTLQVHLSKLRKALGPDVIQRTPAGYRLASELGVGDVDRFEELFAAGREALAAGDARGAAEMLAEALALWRGPALADVRYEAFAQAEAARLDELRLACMEARVEADLALGRHVVVVGELEALILEQPLRERLRGQLIVALYRSGRQAEALAQYQATRRTLANDLGLEPSPELRELERMILAHDPSLAAPKTTSQAPSNLPFQPTPFIGREQELAELVRLIRSGNRRLVTLTGPGGSGKTRLAIEAARELQGDYPGGVWWVPLQLVTDAEFVLATIAGIVEASGDVATHISDGRVLLLVDNFEHVLAAAAETASLLARCPNLTVLVTSRERLRVAGELEHRVQPMTEVDAIALFDERAEQGEAHREVVAAICRRLDCLPLAIELAAARIGTFTAEEILGLLERRLSFLGAGPRDAPARQQTLQATVAWSYDLLAEDEQRLFRALTVFRGGWSFAAAESICAAEPDTLQSLLDKSLVQKRQSEFGTRYSLLETIREFARDLWQPAGELEVLRQRHVDWYLARAEEATAAKHGDEIPAWIDGTWFHDELPNLREAFAWCFEHPDAGIVHRLAASAGVDAWFDAGAFDEGIALLNRVLAETGPMSPAHRARVLYGLALIREARDEVTVPEALAEEVLELFERAGDASGAFYADLLLARRLAARGAVEQARSRLEHVQEVYPPATDHARARLCLSESFLQAAEGNYARAQALVEEEIALLALHGRPRSWYTGQFANLAHWAICAGDFTRARSACLEQIGERSSQRRHIASARVNLGIVELFEGDCAAAAANFYESLEFLSGSGEAGHISTGLVGSAVVAAMDGDRERALRLWGTADTILHAVGAQLTKPQQLLFARYINPAYRTLTHDSAAKAKAEGAAMTVNEAVTYALEGLLDTQTRTSKSSSERLREELV